MHSVAIIMNLPLFSSESLEAFDLSVESEVERTAEEIQNGQF